MNGLWYLIGVGVVLLASSDLCRAVDEAEAKEMVRGMAAECKEKEGASDAEVDDMVDKKMPSTKPAKCLNACMMEQFGIIVDGKFVPDGLVEVTKLATEGDEEKVKVVTEIAEECKDTADDDRCELAVKIMQCMAQGAKARGINTD